MSQVNTLLTQRLKKSDPSSKMAAMAQQSANGRLTSFSGIFSVTELTDGEKKQIEMILNQYAHSDEDIPLDLSALASLTSEVKAINNQAAILHGERIKKAYTILGKYRDGAFTAWLMAAYGNRQTPYNFLQYYEFYEAMPKSLRPRIETMPRQAIYTLASREGSLDKKRSIIENYKGGTKIELLNLIRDTFPLNHEDGRRGDAAASAIQSLSKLSQSLQKNRSITFTKKQKNTIFDLLQEIRRQVEQLT